jgi:hypothetical protein
MVQEISREVYRARSLGIEPYAALSLASIRRVEREKREEEVRRLFVEEQETCMVPAIPKSPPLDTEKLVAQILPRPEQLYVEKIASSNYHTIDLINQAVDELCSTPLLIEISNLRYVAMGSLQTRFRFYYHGILVPFRPADRSCDFDVRVYGYRA